MKKLTAYVLILVMVIACIPLGSQTGTAYAASAYTKILSGDGVLEGREYDTYNFKMPADGTAKVHFTDDTYGDYTVVIEDSTGQAVYSKRGYIGYDTENLYASLKTGSYTLIIGTDDYYGNTGGYDDEEDYYDDDYSDIEGESLNEFYFDEEDEDDWYYDSEFEYDMTLSWKADSADITSFSLSNTSLAMKKGATKTLGVKVSPSYADKSLLSWSSSNTSVATVSSSGKITAKSMGKAVIKAKYGSMTKSCTVKVNTASATVLKGKTLSLKNYVKNVSGYSKAKWSSSSTSVATVSSNGTVTGKKPGKATITATIGGQKYKTTVTVKNRVTCKVTSIDDVGIYNDCYVKFTNNTGKTITYIKFNIKQYDNKWSRVSSPYSYYYVNDSLAAHSSDTWYFWVNDDCMHAKAYITKVYFSDGTTWTP